MKIKKAALRAEDSGAPWGRLEENGGFLLSNTALPPAQLRSSPLFPQAAAGWTAIPALAKAGKGGKGKGVRCTAGPPVLFTTRARSAATRPGAGRRRRRWGSALVLSGVSRRLRNGVRALTELRDAPPPNPLFFLLPEALGRKPGCICWETCRDWEPVCAPQACKAERAAFGSVQSLSRGTGKQGRVGAGGGKKQSRCSE